MAQATILDELESVVSSPRQLAVSRIQYGGALAEAFVQQAKKTSNHHRWILILARIIRSDPTLGEEIVGNHSFPPIQSWLNSNDTPSTRCTANSNDDESDNEDDDEDVSSYKEAIYRIMAFQKQFPTKQSFAIEELRHRLPVSLSFDGGISVLIHQVTQRQSAQSDVGFVLWPSAVILASYLVEQCNTNRSSYSCCLNGATRILELGSGCGLTGIVAAQLVMASPSTTSRTVILTDCNRTVLRNLQRNIVLNEVQDTTSVIGLDFSMLQNDYSCTNNNGNGTSNDNNNNNNTWNDMDGNVHEPVDLILAADVICQPSDAIAVAQTIDRLLNKINGQAILVSATAAHRFGVNRLAMEFRKIPRLDITVTDIVGSATTQSLLERTSGYVPGMKLHIFHVNRVQ